MSLSFKKTPRQQKQTHYSYIAVGIALLITGLYYLTSFSGTPDPNSMNYETVVQAKLLFFKLKVASCLVVIGSLGAYTLIHLLTHSPLGQFMFKWSEKDDSIIKSAKSLSLSIVFGAVSVAIFFLLSTVIGR